jgi:hypothetical protein
MHLLLRKKESSFVFRKRSKKTFIFSQLQSGWPLINAVAAAQEIKVFLLLFRKTKEGFFLPN